MKRRSFLAMLGLMPASGFVGEAEARSSPVPTEVPIGAVAGYWICPDYEAACEDARVSGVREPSVRFHLARVEPSTENPAGTELQLLDESGRVVMRQWNRK